MSTFGKFKYNLRPAKNIERKMFCDFLGRLARVADLSRYRYVGFGSVEFCDFRLFHERLGISDMISIEERVDVRERVEFNRPFGFIKMKWGKSHEIMSGLPWDKRAVVWLDYDKPITSKHLQDIETVALKARSGSMLIVTVPVEAGEWNSADGAEGRLKKLVNQVGRKKVPLDTKALDLAKWGMARVVRDIIHREIVSVIADRNSPQPLASRVEYFQTLNFHYADGVKMLTTGGLILDHRDRSRLNPQSGFKGLEFVRQGDQPFLIESAVLTVREMRLLESKMPKCLAVPEWMPEGEAEKFRRVYRYYPKFGEVEAQ